MIFISLVLFYAMLVYEERKKARKSWTKNYLRDVKSMQL